MFVAHPKSNIDFANIINNFIFITYFSFPLTTPPLGFATEEKLLFKPFSFYVKCFTLPDIFAGKMHALLFRKWKRSVKGRDWYDMEWYKRKGIPLNLDHWAIRSQDSGNWKEKLMTPKQFMNLLQNKIQSVFLIAFRKALFRFITDDKVIEI